MTFKRDIEKDRARTNELMNGPAEERAGQAGRRPNWLGHRGDGNAAIDALLLQGATLAELEQHRDVHTHLTHLRSEHGLHIDLRSGRYIFAAS